MLYLLRDPQLSLTLMAESLDEGTNPTLSEELLQPLGKLVETLNLEIRGVVSDAQSSIRLAVARTWPGVPHQACQFHCLREAGKLTFEADRKMKTRLKASFREKIKRLRKSVARLSQTDPFRAVLSDYTEAVHSTLLEGGIAPFELGGVRVFEALDEVAASLTRCQKKETIPSCGV